MSSPATLPLSNIVNVTVLISPQAPAQPQFNQGLIVGNSGAIPSTGANSRMRLYPFGNWSAAMLGDGFTLTSPEYIAASLYFSQSPTPLYLWVGCQDPAGLNVVIPHAGNAGTGYHVGDVVTVTQGSAAGGTLKVTTIGGSGAVTGLALVTSGTGYSVATALNTTGGLGTGLEVDISSVGEPALQAVIACRAKSFAWYGFMVTDAADADHLALALWAQTASPYVVYFYNTADAAVLNNTGGNIAAVMQAANYNRALGWYSTTQSGLFPNNIYTSAAALGVAMGLTTGLANSYFTLKFKALTGVGTEPITQTQVTALEGLNINLYLNYANSYSFGEQGEMANGQFFDQISNLDILVSNIQYGIMNLLTGSPSIPQTDPGEAQLIHVVNQAADVSRQIGFIAGGVWQGVQIINLQPGTTLPKGYLAQAYPYSTQLPADRAARKAMPIYLAIILAGAVHSLVIGVYVQR
jgi:hypothetical protein